MWYWFAVTMSFGLSMVLGLENETPHAQTFEKCPIAFFQKKFDILPGRGWDNLNNEEMGQVLNLNFSKCQFSQDNIYLLPNSVSITPIKSSEVELNTDAFSHFNNYTTVTSNSINMEAHGSFFGASFGGSFSKEKQRVKSDQLQTKSKIIRVQLRYKVFKSISEPDAELHPTFRNRIIDIAGLVIEDKDSLYPQYLADMIVRDYGTHVIHSIEAGAVLSKIDSLQSSYTKQFESNTDKISASASASFGNIFGMSAKYSNRVTREDIDKYDSSCSKTRIDTHGGTLYGANFSLDQWRQSVMDNMVPIDKTGDPLYYVITPRALRELDDSTVNKVYTLIKDAVTRYFSANARRGCLDFQAANFNPDANIDAENCESPKVTFNFGGVYQTCSGPKDQCQSIEKINSLTGGYSCPSNYESVLLNSGLYECREYCYSSWIFWKKCHTDCSYYQSFWCFPPNVNETFSGYRFGGFISNKMKICPLEYFPLNIGLKAQMCVSVSNDPLNQDAIKFGGLYSCSAGNPLARSFVYGTKYNLKSLPMTTLKNWPKGCAKGYISHLANIDQGCEISYCTETNKVSLGSSPLLSRPPFISLNYNPNSTKVVVFSTAKGQTFIKSQHDEWETDDPKTKARNILIGSVVGTFFGIFSLCIIIVVLQRRSYKKKIAKLKAGSPTSDQGSENYGSINDDREA